MLDILIFGMASNNIVSISWPDINRNLWTYTLCSETEFLTKAQFLLVNDIELHKS